MKRTSLTLAAMLSLLPATIAHAQFGSGIVYDPTQSAHAITQIEHEERSISNQIQQIENGQQIFSNTVKIANTALQTYNQVRQQYNLDRQMTLAQCACCKAEPSSTQERPRSFAFVKKNCFEGKLESAELNRKKRHLRHRN